MKANVHKHNSNQMYIHLSPAPILALFWSPPTPEQTLQAKCIPISIMTSNMQLLARRKHHEINPHIVFCALVQFFFSHIFLSYGEERESTGKYCQL